MNKWFIGLVVCVASSVLPHTIKAAELERIVVADSSDKFVVLAKAIRQEMQPGGRFEFIAGRSRAEVNHGLDGNGRRGENQALQCPGKGQWSSGQKCERSIDLQLCLACWIPFACQEMRDTRGYGDQSQKRVAQHARVERAGTGAIGVCLHQPAVIRRRDQDWFFTAGHRCAH